VRKNGNTDSGQITCVTPESPGSAGVSRVSLSEISRSMMCSGSIEVQSVCSRIIGWTSRAFMSVRGVTSVLVSRQLP
jgi:hypothetical protein